MMILEIILSIFTGVFAVLFMIEKKRVKEINENFWEYKKQYLLKDASEAQRKAYEKIRDDINNKPIDELIKDE